MAQSQTENTSSPHVTLRPSLQQIISLYYYHNNNNNNNNNNDITDLGVDKIAAIIQTGRDHGLPTYTQVREYCGLPAINNFNDLNNTIEEDIIQLLRSVYRHQDDVDLVVGGLAERPLSGAVVGPTFGCLLGQQFQILKKGDRFSALPIT